MKTMKSTVKLIGIIVLVAVIGFTACGNGSTGGGGGSKKTSGTTGVTTGGNTGGNTAPSTPTGVSSGAVTSNSITIS